MSRKPIALASLSNRWDATNASYLTGRAHLDGVDELAIRMENYWGCDRLRLLVDTPWREKFDRQRVKLNNAICHGTLANMIEQTERMTVAWRKLDELARAAGEMPLEYGSWEVVLEDGTVAAIVKDDVAAHAAIADERARVVFTLEEIGRLLSRYREVVGVKLTFPGAQVARVAKSVSDPIKDLGPDAELDDLFVQPTVGA